MNRKRTLLPDIYKQKKKVCTSVSSLSSPQVNGDSDSIQHNKKSQSSYDVCELRTSLLHLRELFPADKFDYRLPPIILKHQLYSLLKDKTNIDKKLNILTTNGEIKLFKLGSDADEYCILFTDDYRDHVTKVMKKLNIHLQTSDRFVKSVINNCHDVCINKDTLMKEYSFSDDEITQLVKASVLTVKELGTWWLSIPNAGTFMKCFLRGRKAVLTMIRKCKYREILRQELEQRKWPKVCRLGLIYHVHEIIGKELVECIQTTSGELLRLKE